MYTVPVDKTKIDALVGGNPHCDVISATHPTHSVARKNAMNLDRKSGRVCPRQFVTNVILSSMEKLMLRRNE